MWPSEANYLRLTLDQGVKGVAIWFDHHRIASIERMRNGLSFPAPHRFRNMPPDASALFHNPSRRRHFLDPSARSRV
jgi:hypothetical protein